MARCTLLLLLFAFVVTIAASSHAKWRNDSAANPYVVDDFRTMFPGEMVDFYESVSSFHFGHALDYTGGSKENSGGHG